MDTIEGIREQFEKELRSLSSPLSKEALQKLKVDFLGKKGRISRLMQVMGSLPSAERPAYGKKVNELKTHAADLLEKIADESASRELEEQIAQSAIDSSLPGIRIKTGSIHPLNQVKTDIIKFFSNLGFQIVRGREIETDWYNFEALNIPPEHPARDMQDTFYVRDKVVLRTQTSNDQIHIMESRKPPFRIIAPGFVYRADSDASHSPMFQQVEGLVVDKDISFTHLKGTLYLWVKEMFGEDIKLRFRPSFFPFTEPSAEMDISCSICGGKGCRVCSNTGWLEIGGCGCVDPNVFIKAGIDPEVYTGFAFGFGIDRITMLKFGIPEIGLLTSNDNRFLKQF